MRPNCCPPPIPPCPPEPPGESINFYAQYGVQSSPPSGSNLPLIPIFQEGTQIHLNGNTEIILPPGYLYLINYLLLATTEPDNYMQIVPRINGTLQLLYSFLAPAGSGSRNTSAAGSFTTNAAATEEARLSFSLTYPPEVGNIDISGAISVTPLIKISTQNTQFSPRT